jgi:protein TonB
MNQPKTLIALLTCIVFAVGARAQDTTKTQSNIFIAIEHEPDFPGGLQAFYKYIGSNLRYPKVAKVLGLTGKVYLTFVIDKDGSVRCLGAGFESEAVRVVSMSPKRSPGIQKGQTVRVSYTMPINLV